MAFERVQYAQSPIRAQHDNYEGNKDRTLNERRKTVIQVVSVSGV